MSDVSLLRCESYESITLDDKVTKLINMLGGIEKFVKKDAKVFIKLNCLGPFSKEMGITTHPNIVESVIKLVRLQTTDITIGDNPATKDITYTLKKNGVYPLVSKYDLKVINGLDTTIISNSQSTLYSTFEVSREMIECDTLINIAKLKTHTLTYMTGCQKNFFGLIYGLNKAGWHVKANNPDSFSKAFNDLYGALLDSFNNKTILNILDGILGLEGEGPSTGGKAKNAYCILASKDALAIDYLAAKIVKLDTNNLILNKEGQKRGYTDINKINILGDDISMFNDVSFETPKSTVGSFGLKLIKKPLFRNILLEHPLIDHTKCIKCGECAKICPPHTMVLKPKNFPTLSSKKCIRCWCCAEVCPQNAIHKSRKPLIGRIVFK